MIRNFVSQPFTQLKGKRAGQTYRVKRGLKSGAAVRVYDPTGSGPRQTAVIAKTKPAVAPARGETAKYAGPLVTRHSAKRGGDVWQYRRGASGKLIPYKPA